MKKLSIVIAAYNGEKYVKECLDSFLDDTTVSELDVIFVDNGSNDDTLKIAKEYERKYSDALRVIHQEPNRGPGSVYNLGIKQAKGKYWLSLDIDDRIKKPSLLGLLEQIDSFESDLVFFDMEVFRDKKVLRIYSYRKLLQENETYAFDTKIKKARKFIHCFMIRTDLLKNNNCQVGSYSNCHDIELNLKIFVASRTCSYIGVILYEYRLSKNQGSNWSSIIKNRNNFYEAGIHNSKLISLTNSKDLPKNISEVTNKHCFIHLWTSYYLTMFESEQRRKEVLLELDKALYKTGKKMPLSVKMARSNNFIIRAIMKKIYIFIHTYLFWNS